VGIDEGKGGAGVKESSKGERCGVVPKSSIGGASSDPDAVLQAKVPQREGVTGN